MFGASRFSHTTPQIKVIKAFDGFCIKRLARLAGPSVCNPALGEVRTHAPPHDQLPAAVGRLCLHCQNGWNQEKNQKVFEVPLRPSKKKCPAPFIAHLTTWTLLMFTPTSFHCKPHASPLLHGSCVEARRARGNGTWLVLLWL